MKIGGQRIPGKTLVLVASEALLIACGLIFATALRFMNAQAFRQEISHPGVILRYSIVIVVCSLSLYYYDLYDLQIVSRRAVLFVRLLQALGTACLCLAMLYYWSPDLSLGRGIAAVAAPVIVCLVSGWRLLVDASAPLLRRNERILIVGDGAAGSYLTDEILRRPELNIDIIGILSERRRNGETQDEQASQDGSECYSPLPAQFSLRYHSPVLQSRANAGLMMASLAPAGGIGAATVMAEGPVEARSMTVLPSVLGTPADVERFAASESADRIVLSLSERRGSMPLKELLQLKFQGMKIEEAHDVYERTTGRILLDHLSPSWLILADGFRKSRLVVTTKRLIDIVVSVIGLVASAPIMLLVALAVYAESGAPVLFRQERIGLHGKPFLILKFRSMRNEPTPAAASWTSDMDPRITRVGKFIRKFRLDELPQLLNVLRGDMSLVGPRPEQPTLAAMLEDQLPYYRLRHFMRPGITGWAQVKYGYGGTVEQTKIKLEHDLFYIKHLSTPLDLAIIFETAKVLLSGRGAK